MKKRYSLSLIVITLFILILTYGCTNNPFSIYGEPAIFIEVSRFIDSNDSVRTFARGDFMGVPGTPIIIINNDTLSSMLYTVEKYSNGEEVSSGFFGEFISNDPEDKYELIVPHDLGEARAEVTMPSGFEITTPQNNDTLNIEEDLFVGWGPSDNAERYILNVHMEYLDSIDSTLNLRNWIYFDSLVNTTNTSANIPNVSIFPLVDPDSIKCGSGDIMIKSENGPSVRFPLDTSGRNISGNGVGYFVAANYTHYDDNFLHVIIKDDSTTNYIEEGYAEFDGLYGMHYGHAYYDSRMAILYQYDPEFTKFLELQE